jgi:hypothetical protein
MAVDFERPNGRPQTLPPCHTHRSNVAGEMSPVAMSNRPNEPRREAARGRRGGVGSIWMLDGLLVALEPEIRVCSRRTRPSDELKDLLHLAADHFELLLV